MNNPGLVSIIIPTIKRVDLVQKCVSSLISITKGIKYEIIVIDDGSNQQEKRKLQHLAKKYNFSLILKTHNTGFAKTVNYGIKAAIGDYIVIVNNDIIFTQANWLTKMVNTARLDRKIGIVGCRLLYPNNQIQHAGVSFNPKDRFRHDYRFAPADHPPALKIKPIGFVTGALMLIKRETVEQIGLLDESYFIACEDTEYCLRAREAGWIVIYCGEAKAIHLEGATRGNTPENKVLEWYKKELNGIRRLFKSITIPPEKKDINPPVNLLNNRPQIVYVLPFLGISAGVKSVLEQANRLADRGYRVAIFSLNAHLDWFNLKVPLITYQNYEMILGALKKLNCLKIATWWETAPLVYQSCDPEQGGQGRSAYFVQDMEDKFYPRSPEIQNKVKATYLLPMLFFTGSEWVKTQLEEQYQQPAINIGHAIDLDIFQPQKKVIDYDCRRGIAYGKEDHLKNLSQTEQALAKAAEKIRYLSVITFGPQPTKLTQIPHLHFSKFDDQQLAYLYNSGGFFIHNSLHEDFGLPILEAMACGTPVITTKAQGNLEYCQDGYNCLLTSPNDVTELAEKIQLVITERRFAHYLASNGVKTAQKYTWAKTMDNLEKLLNI